MHAHFCLCDPVQKYIFGDEQTFGWMSVPWECLISEYSMSVYPFYITSPVYKRVLIKLWRPSRIQWVSGINEHFLFYIIDIFIICVWHKPIVHHYAHITSIVCMFYLTWSFVLHVFAGKSTSVYDQMCLHVVPNSNDSFIDLIAIQTWRIPIAADILQINQEPFSWAIKPQNGACLFRQFG